jgi:hypothetical protein
MFKLGELLLKAKHITEVQLSKILDAKHPEEKIGQTFKRHHVLTESQLQSVLKFQENSPIKLGELLLTEGCITRPQLDEALTLQQTTGIKLGEALVSLGYISYTKIDHTLSVQKILVHTTVAMLLAASIGTNSSASLGPKYRIRSCGVYCLLCTL